MSDTAREVATTALSHSKVLRTSSAEQVDAILDALTEAGYVVFKVDDARARIGLLLERWLDLDEGDGMGELTRAVLRALSEPDA